MIVNPVVYGGGKTYHIEADQLAQQTGFPANGSAKAGEYVVSTSGIVVGTARLLTADKKYTITSVIERAYDVDELPPLARKKLELENVPAALAVPPPSAHGYLFFVMPEEDVYIETCG